MVVFLGEGSEWQLCPLTRVTYLSPRHAKSMKWKVRISHRRKPIIKIHKDLLPCIVLFNFFKFQFPFLFFSTKLSFIPLLYCLLSLYLPHYPYLKDLNLSLQWLFWVLCMLQYQLWLLLLGFSSLTGATPKLIRFVNFANWFFCVLVFGIRTQNHGFLSQSIFSVSSSASGIG